MLFVLDASGSMWGRVDGEPKIDVARRVLGGLVRDLPADVSVGLQAYGHPRKDDCNDIEILAPPGSSCSQVVPVRQCPTMNSGGCSTVRATRHS